MKYEDALKKAKGKAATGTIIVQVGATSETFKNVMWHDMGSEYGAFMIGTGGTNLHIAFGYPEKLKDKPYQALYPVDFPEHYLIWEYYDRKGRGYTAQKGEITGTFLNQFKKIDGKFNFTTADGTIVHGEYHLESD